MICDTTNLTIVSNDYETMPVNGPLYNNGNIVLDNNNKNLNKDTKKRADAFNTLSRLRWDMDALMLSGHTEYYYTLKKFPAPTNEYLMRIELDGANLFVQFCGAHAVKNMREVLDKIIIPRKLNAHEVPREYCKIPIDLDMPDDVLAGVPLDDATDWSECDEDDLIEAKLTTVKDAVINAFNATIVLMCGKEPVFLEATRNRPGKYSSHFICSNLTANKESQKSIYNDVVDELKCTVVGRYIIDTAIFDDIYGKRSLAMVGSFKNGQQLVCDGGNFTDYFINNTKGVEQMSTPEAHKPDNTQGDNGNNGDNNRPLNRQFIYDAVKDYADMAGFTQAGEKKNNIHLTRTHCVECAICKRTHDKNTWSYLSISRQYGVWLRCWRQTKGTRGIKLMSVDMLHKLIADKSKDADKDKDEGEGDDEGDEEEEEEADGGIVVKPHYLPETKYDRLRRYVAYTESFPLFYDNFDALEKYKDDEHAFHPYYDIYDAKYMKPYPDDKDLYIKANMNSGKTYTLVKYLERYIANVDEGVEPTICMVSFRRTFTADNMRRFEGLGITSYLDIKGEIKPSNNPIVIVQVESLGRIRGSYSRVIIDEGDAVADQFFSETMRDGRGASNAFHSLVSYADRVVVMDANLSDRVVDYVSSYREDIPAVIIKNTRTSGNYTSSFTTSKPLVMSKILTALEDGKRIAVAMTVSTNQSTALAEVIRAKYPDRKVKLYNKHTPQSEKDADFTDLNTAWDDADVLIYTPTLQAGISYEVAPGEEFDQFFGIFSSNSTNVDAARQMIHRVRSFKNKEYTICLTGRSVPVWYDNVYQFMDYLGECSAELQKVPAYMAEEKRHPDRIVRIKTTPIFKLYCDTKVRASGDKVLFMSNFLKAEHRSGAKLKVLSFDTECDILKKEVYAAIGFTPVLVNRLVLTVEANELLVPEYKQMLYFLKDNATRIMKKKADGAIDGHTAGLIDRYQEVAEHLVRTDARRKNADNVTLPEVKKTAIIKQVQSELKEAELTEMSKLPMPSSGMVERITDNIEGNRDVTPAEILQLKLYNIAKLYDVDPVPKDAERNRAYIKAFSSPKLRTLFRNLQAMEGACFSIDDMRTRIHRIQGCEYDKHTNTLAYGDTTEHILSIEKAKGAKFMTALNILEATGFQGLTDTNTMTRATLEENLTEFVSSMDKHTLTRICKDFGKKQSRVNLKTGTNFVRHVLLFINPILTQLFGVSVGKLSQKRADINTFELRRLYNTHFTISAGGITVNKDLQPRDPDAVAARDWDYVDNLVNLLDKPIVVA